MSYTYKINSTGYSILKDGVLYIVQNDYIPFPAETMEESAKLHIEDLNKVVEEKDSLESQIAELQENNAILLLSSATQASQLEEQESKIIDLEDENANIYLQLATIKGGNE